MSHDNWKNWETWCAVQFYHNAKGFKDHCRTLAQELPESVLSARLAMEAFYFAYSFLRYGVESTPLDELFGNFLSDEDELEVHLSRIDWREVARSFLNDVEGSIP